MNSPAYQDKRDASVRKYLLKALRRAGLSGLQWDILSYIIEETYGWEDLERKANGQRQPRRDRNRFWYQAIADECEVSWDAIARAMRKLIHMNIVTEYSAPSKASPGEYGINSDPSSWNVERMNGESDKKVSKNRSMGRARSRPITNISPSPSRPITNIGPSPSRPIEEMGRLGSVNFTDGNETNVAGNADNHAVCEVPNLDNLDKIPPISPKGEEAGVLDPEVIGGRVGYVLIESGHAALDRQSMSVDEAVWQAERHYHKRFIRDFDNSPRKREAEKMKVYFESSDFRGSLLKIWIEAMTPVFDDRRKRAKDPERSKYVSRSPFGDCLKFVQDEVSERKRVAELRHKYANPSDDDDEPCPRPVARGRPIPSGGCRGKIQLEESA